MAEKVVYCTKDDVQRWIKRVQFSTSSKVTPSDVNAFIAAVSNVVDGKLRKMGVALPITRTATVSLEILKLLVTYEAASFAEQAAFFGSNKNESSHGKWLHQQYLDLLEQIESNPSMLSDVVTASVAHMKSDTEDMLPDGTKEGDEVFTKKSIEDFVANNKILSASEKTPESSSITGEVSKERV